MDNKPISFLHWAGGKRRLLHEINRFVPNKIGTYYEPFLGGGAVFFRYYHRMEYTVLSDLNEELITTYIVVRDHVDDLIEALKIHEKNHVDKEYYYHIREKEYNDPIDIAARMIYLNKTCYNGLYRVNSKGKFNVARGTKKQYICPVRILQSASKALGKAEISAMSFSDRKQFTGNSFVYCDPPYDGTFTSYQADKFDWIEQEKLKKWCDEWTDKGAKVIISNSDTQRIRELYTDYNLFEVNVAKTINRDITNRKKSKELIIVNKHIKLPCLL